MKGKLSDLDSESFAGQETLDLSLNVDSKYLNESIEALLALGYTKTEVKKVAKKLQDFDGKSTDDFLRQGLRLIMK